MHGTEESDEARGQADDGSSSRKLFLVKSVEMEIEHVISPYFLNIVLCWSPSLFV